MDRELQALTMLEVVDCDEEDGLSSTKWFYSLRDGINPDVI